MRSLTFRLLVGLVGAQVLAVVVAMLLFPLLAPYVSYATIAESTTRRLVLESLQRDADGALTLAPSSQLRAYAAKRPGLVYGVFNPATQRLAQGSDPDMGLALRHVAPILPRQEGTFEADRPGASGGTIIMAAAPTSAGGLIVASAGNQFGFDDIGSFFRVFLPGMAPLYGPIFLGAFIFLPWFVRKSLKPLNRAAAAARSIDARAPQARLPTQGVQREFLPLIEAVNAALDRLDQGLASQRLYAANAAHELRTPVAILRGRIEALPDPDRRAELARDANRISALVEQWLTVARLGRPDAAMDEDVDLVELLRHVVADRAPLALRNRREIELQALINAFHVRGNASAIASAIGNLIDNAVAAEPEGGVVTARIDADGMISIIDHGGGVPEHLREAIFEPFRRAPESGSWSGSGLGLAIVREVAHRHGGSADVGDTPGRGATFHFRIGQSRKQPLMMKEQTV